jgi:hypothetical protein
MDYKLTNDEQFMEKYFFGEELSVRENSHVYDPEYFERPEEYLDITPYGLSVLEKVKSAFKKAGWEGTGDLGLMYVRPFISDKPPDYKTSIKFIGSFIWHVRQKSNNTSFLGLYPNSLQSVGERSGKISAG